MPDLWQATLEHVTPLINVGALHPLDRETLSVVVKELYVAGERPTAEETDEYLRALWAGSDAQTRRVVKDFFRKLERNPTHRFQIPNGRYRFRRPFLLVDEAAEACELGSVGERIAAASAAAQHRFADLAARQPGSPELEAAQREVFAEQRALEVWAAAQEALPDAGWPAYILQPRGIRDEALERLTVSGHARFEERLERYRREHYGGLVEGIDEAEGGA